MWGCKKVVGEKESGLQINTGKIDSVLGLYFGRHRSALSVTTTKVSPDITSHPLESPASLGGGMAALENSYHQDDTRVVLEHGLLFTTYIRVHSK